MRRICRNITIAVLWSTVLTTAGTAQDSYVVFTVGAGIEKVEMDGSNHQFLTTEASDRSPRISPDGSTIAFWRGLDLHSIRSDGTNQRVLSENAAVGLSRNLCWSPDGDQLAYAEGPPGSTRLHTINSDGSGQVTLYALDDFAQAPLCDWSLDGEIYISFGPSGQASGLEIVACRTDGTGCRQVTSYPGSALAEFPRLSSSRDRLFYSTRPNPFGQPRTLRRSELDGSGETTITGPGSDASAAGAFSNRIYFTDDVGGDFQVYSSAEDGTDLVQESNILGGVSKVADVFVLSCAFGPPDQPIVFARSVGRPVWESVEWESCGGTGTLEIESHQVASATIYLNGELVFGPSDFNMGVTALSAEVVLLEGVNTLDVQLGGMPGGRLEVELLKAP